MLMMHMVTLAVSAILTVLVMLYVIVRLRLDRPPDGNARYVTQGRLSQFVESLICWLRDEMIEPVLGERGTKRWLPLLLTLFFFILINNLIGLILWLICSIWLDLTPLRLAARPPATSRLRLDGLGFFRDHPCPRHQGKWCRGVDHAQFCRSSGLWS